MNRQEEILKAIVEEHIDTANPVSSGLLVEKYFSDISSATVRNDMADLEERGLIAQPHTSAGRIPTNAGYRYYIDTLLPEAKLVAIERERLEAAVAAAQNEEAVKLLAKALAELADNAVLVAFSPLNVYYTGISNLFRQPEFTEHAAVSSISTVIDHLDEVMAKVFARVTSDVMVLVGDDNPFGARTSVVLTRYHQMPHDGFIAILGPSRMRYASNIELLRHSQKLLSTV
ncbi:MAG: hypothetical protein KBB55_00865 [Candidatus Buchananbacteria bacterium]|nr:hypothetical protein [Candidatus Buchananbacteria bacterium]